MSTSPLRCALCLLLSICSTAAVSQTPSDEALFKLYFEQRFFAKLAPLCVEAHPELEASVSDAQMRFSQAHAANARSGQQVAEALLTKRGKTIDQVVDALMAEETRRAGGLVSTGAASLQQCRELITSMTANAELDLAALVKRDFDHWLSAVEHSQGGYRCSSLHSDVRSVSQRFLNPHAASADRSAKSPLDFVLLFEVQRLSKAAANCESAKQRAADRRIELPGEFALMRETLLAILNAMEPALLGRVPGATAVPIAVERATQFLKSHGSQ